MGAPRRLLGGLTPARFLSRHWQKRPLLVRGALPEFRDPLTPDELAGLACQAGVESRLVLQRGGERPWQVVSGPQDPRRLRRLPRSHWTLLVQGVERHLPALLELQEQFDFVPRWRRDDVMVSFAPRHGGVGPHIDSYDVFLLQGQGERRWQLDTRPDGALRRGLDLRVLRHFRPEQEWVLERGDVLYVPPGVAHHGVALSDCLTYSIGFRAPSQRDVVLGFLQRVLAHTPEDTLYADPELRVTRDPGLVSAAALRRLRGILRTACARVADEAAFARFAGELLTQPADEPEPARRIRAAALAAPSLVLQRHAATRVAHSGRGARSLLHVDGRSYRLGRALAFAGPLLCGRSPIALGPELRRPGFRALLAELVSAGGFELLLPQPARGARA